MLDQKDIVELVEDHGAWAMSDFQSRYFVVNSHVTDYRRVRQALLEIETRISSKKQIERNMRKCSIELKIKQEDYDKEPHPLKKELILVDIDQLNYDMSVYKKKLKISEDELATFCEIISSIVPDKLALEAYKKQDDEKEREYWIARMGKQACMDIMTIGRIGQGNLDSIAMMPIGDQEETIKVALTYSAALNQAIGSMENKVKSELQKLKVDNNFTLLSNFNKSELKLNEEVKRVSNKSED